jgi:hypothetical protein
VLLLANLLLRSKIDEELHLFDPPDAHLPNEADDPRGLKVSAVMSLAETHWKGWRLPILKVDTWSRSSKDTNIAGVATSSRE